MGKHCYHTSSSFLERTVPRNLESCFKGSFAFLCISDCSPVMVLGRGWGFTRLTFLSRLSAQALNLAVGGRELPARVLPVQSLPQQLRQQWDPCGGSVQVMFSREKGLGNLCSAVFIPRTRKGGPHSARTVTSASHVCLKFMHSSAILMNLHQKNRSPG